MRRRYFTLLHFLLYFSAQLLYSSGRRPECWWSREVYWYWFKVYSYTATLHWGTKYQQESPGDMLHRMIIVAWVTSAMRVVWAAFSQCEKTNWKEDEYKLLAIRFFNLIISLSQSKLLFANHSQGHGYEQARKPRSYASLKLRPTHSPTHRGKV